MPHATNSQVLLSSQHRRDEWLLSPDLPTIPLDILLVEDSPSDEILTYKALEATQINSRLKILRRGSDVMHYLRDCRHSKPVKMPDLLLLDLGLPGIDGFEVLSELNTAPTPMRAIPIVILTGYTDFSYICGIYDLCFFAYLPKPCSADVMKSMLETVRGDMFSSSPS